VHSKLAELKFVADGDGVKRHPVMYDDLVLVGPKSDPARIKAMDDVAKALKKIKDNQARPLVPRVTAGFDHVVDRAADAIHSEVSYHGVRPFGMHR
jgi:tungstate transport system substrate-binding protein